MVARGWVEPLTLRFSAGRSYQLRYLAVADRAHQLNVTGPNGLVHATQLAFTGVPHHDPAGIFDPAGLANGTYESDGRGVAVVPATS